MLIACSVTDGALLLLFAERRMADALTDADVLITCSAICCCLQSVEWRMRWRADHVLTDWKCPDVLKQYDIGGKVCYDKQGCPVYIYLNANLDTKGQGSH